MRVKESEMSHVTTSGDERERTRGITCKGFLWGEGERIRSAGPVQGRARPGQANGKRGGRGKKTSDPDLTFQTF